MEARAPNAVVGEVVAAACAGEKQQREAALAGVHAEFMARLLAEARAREVRLCAATKKTNSRGSRAAAGAAAGRGSWRGVDAWTMRCGETHQLNLCAPEPTPAPERTSSPGMRRATPTVGFAKNHHRGDRAALTTHALHAVRTWQAVMIYS